MNLLITGGSGFIGSNVIHHVIDQPGISNLINLDCLTYAGHLANLANVRSHPKYSFEQVDLRDRQALSQVFQKHAVSGVLHLAAESHVDRSITGPKDFITTNILGTFNLLECCREFWNLDQPVPNRFHHVSTDEVYGSLGPSGYFTESSPYAPNSPYSASKASSNMLVRAYHHTYRLNTVITNCSNNYGPYQFPEKLIPVVIRNLMLRKQIPVYGDGLNVRDWLYVRDHAEALWQVFNRGVSGDTYNIGGHNEWANINIVELMCDIFDELRPDAGGDSQKLITYVKDRPGHDRRYAIDAGKIKRELGWKPAYTFEIRIRETIRWYLDNQDWIETVLNEQPNR